MTDELNKIVAELEDAKARVTTLQRQYKQASCLEVGHDWQSFGGANAGCSDWCACSVPVNVCSKCGDCDYGDNDDAEEVRENCYQKEQTT